MAVRSRRLGALTSLSSLMAVAAMAAVAACSSKGGAADDSWTDKPTLSDSEGGSATPTYDAGLEASLVDTTPDDTPPGPLCNLTGAPTSAAGDVLVYSEDFDTGTLDPNKWNVGSGYLGHSGILNTASPANAVENNGLLQIVTDRNPSDTTYPYVSGWIDSLGRFARTYGKVEYRARFPYAGGVWNAVWGRPFNASFPEIDIEVVNRPTDPATELYFVNHWTAPPPGQSPNDSTRSYIMTKAIDVSQFHTYTMTWTPDDFHWDVDGTTIFTAQPQGVPNQPVYWIINSWVGGWPGNPTDATPFPNTFEVDYLHVYRVDGLVADPVIRINNSKTKYHSYEAIEVSTANFDEVCSQVAMYDGDTLLRTMSVNPLRLPLQTLSLGTHNFKFVATDGTRSVTSTLTTEIAQ